MRVQNPDNGRAIVEETTDGVIIAIPSKKNYTVAIVLAVLVYFWVKALLSFFASAMDTNGNDLSPFIALIFFVVFLYYMINSLVWLIAGNEIIVFKKGVMTISFKGLLFSTTKAYHVEEIKQLKTETSVFYPNYFEELKQRTNPFFQKGIVSFNYGMQTITMAGGIDAPEAEYLLQLMVEKGIFKAEQVTIV